MITYIFTLFCPGLSHVTETFVQNHSVHFSRSVMSDSLRPHELRQARTPCPSPTPGVLRFIILKPGKALSNKNEVCQGARKSQVAILDLSQPQLFGLWPFIIHFKFPEDMLTFVEAE